MIARDICTTNLDILYEISKEYGKLSSLPANISKILKKVIIYYRLDNVLPFEFFALKKLGRITNLFPVPVDDIDSGALLKTLNLTPITTKEETLLSKCIAGNGYMYKQGYSEYYGVRKFGPICAQMYSFDFILSGGDILNLYGYNMEAIFKDDGDIEFDLDPEHIQGRLLKGLINAAYRVFNNLITSKDVFTDAWFYQNIYSTCGQTRYILSSVFDNLGSSIRLINHTAEEVTEYIDTAIELTGKYPTREWTIEVVCNTSICLYFYYLYYSTLFPGYIEIVDTYDLMTLLHPLCPVDRLYVSSNDQKDCELTEKFASDYRDWFRDSFATDRFDIIQRFMFAPADSRIQYVMHLKYCDGLDSYLYNMLHDDFGDGSLFYYEKLLYELVEKAGSMIKTYKLEK